MPCSSLDSIIMKDQRVEFPKAFIFTATIRAVYDLSRMMIVITA